MEKEEITHEANGNGKESEDVVAIAFKSKPKGRANIRKRTKDTQEEEEDTTSVEKIRSTLHGKQEPPSLKKAKLKEELKKKIAEETPEHKFIRGIDGSIMVEDPETVKKLNDEFGFDMHNWYKSLKDYTFKSSFEDLALKEAEALILVHEGKLNRAQSPALQDLQQRIHKGINTFISENKIYSRGIFMRTSVRSPKDIILDTPKVCKPIIDELNAMLIKNKSITENECVIEAENNLKRHSKVCSGEDAIDYLCRSARVYEDLKERTQYPQLYDVKIVLREFSEHHISTEFRAFISNNHMTAISQYFTDCYFSDVIKYKKEIENQNRSILEFDKKAYYTRKL